MQNITTKKITLALDAMGGDHAPAAVIAGAAEALIHNPRLHFLLFGDQTLLEPLLATYPTVRDRSTVHHAPESIPPDMKPSIALRQGRKSSMRLAIESVKEGKAEGVISGGNTGALMAMAKLVFRTLPGIDRPAIASLMPTHSGSCVMLDLGANIECSVDNIIQFALMGDAFARALLGKAQPSVGLLNVGSEEMKGHDTLREAARILRKGDLPIQFYGYIEGDDIARGTVDVVVTDGFTGNIALKTAEGTAKICREFLKEALLSNWRSKIGAWLAAPALKGLSRRIDPRRYNGAMFLGLSGVAVKSHGGSDAIGFSNAIHVTMELIAHRINQRIMEELSQYHRNVLKNLDSGLESGWDDDEEGQE